jgi:hypothetical protein
MSFRRYRNYEPNEFYVVFADTAWGGNDYCAAQFLSKTKLDVPVVYHSKTIATEMTPLLHLELETIYDRTNVKPVVAYETNNGGTAELERLAALNKRGKYIIYIQKSGVGTTDQVTDTKKYGFQTNSATRPTMLQDLKQAVDLRLLTIYDKPTVNEMFSFVIKPTSSSWKAQAESGAHDDLIMSLAGAWQMYQTEHPEVDISRLYIPEDTNMKQLWNEI